MKKTTFKNKTLAFSIVAVLSSLTLTACDKKPTDDAHNHAPEEHKHEGETKADEHADHKDEHKQEEHKHEEGHDHDEEGVAHVGKHVHGEAELNATVVGNKVTLELNSPAMNVFGFEHKPSTDEQKATVEAQEKILEDGAKLFSIEGGDCEAKKATVTMPFDAHDDHAHEKEEHAEAHKEEHAEEHKHDDHEHAEGEVHSDVKANYTFECKNAQAINGIKVNVFSAFTGFTKLNAQWIQGNKQGAETLTKEKYNIPFK